MPIIRTHLQHMHNLQVFPIAWQNRHQATAIFSFLAWNLLKPLKLFFIGHFLRMEIFTANDGNKGKLRLAFLATTFLRAWLSVFHFESRKSPKQIIASRTFAQHIYKYCSVTLWPKIANTEYLCGVKKKDVKNAHDLCIMKADIQIVSLFATFNANNILFEYQTFYCQVHQCNAFHSLISNLATFQNVDILSIGIYTRRSTTFFQSFPFFTCNFWVQV